MTLVKAFGQVLRESRKNSGISQEALALICGLDRTFISLLERGQRQPTLSSIFSIAEALESHPSKMLENVEELID